MYATVFVICTIYFSDLSFGSDVSDASTDTEKLFDWEVLCKLQPNSYDCRGKGEYKHRFYYDVLMGDCKSFAFGRCPGNYNSFRTIKDCQQTCRHVGAELVTKDLPVSTFCRLQPDFGWCHEYHPRWYFNVSERTCRGFSFSGCGGNMNRFHNAQTCAGICSTAVKYT